MTELAALALFTRVSGPSESRSTDLVRSHQMGRIRLSERGSDRPSDLVCSPLEGLSFVVDTGSNSGSNSFGRKRLEPESVR